MRAPLTVYLAAFALNLSCSAGKPHDASTHPRGARATVARERSAAPAPLQRRASAPAGTSPVRLRFVGDVMFGRFRKGGYSPIPVPNFFLFGKVQEHLQGELTVANLETPLLEDLPTEFPRRGGLFFGATPDAAAQLTQAGFHAVSLANNHAYDMGRAGIEQTPQILQRLGIRSVGQPHPRGTEFRVESLRASELKVALIGVTTWLNFPVPDTYPAVPYSTPAELGSKLSPLVSQAKRSHDLVAVLVHWGKEYGTRTSQAQRLAAHALVDAGADLVIGHHPHVLGEIELYRRGLIAYSLGNFLFENMSPLPRLTGVLKVDLLGPGRCQTRVSFEPLELSDEPTFHPAPAGARAARKILSLVNPGGPDDTWQVKSGRLSANYSRCDRGGSGP